MEDAFDRLCEMNIIDCHFWAGAKRFFKGGNRPDPKSLFGPDHEGWDMAKECAPNLSSLQN